MGEAGLGERLVIAAEEEVAAAAAPACFVAALGFASRRAGATRKRRFAGIMCDGFNINETHLMVNDHTKHRKPIRRQPGSPSPIVYSVTVTNIGDRPANFAMQGGGNV